MESSTATVPGASAEEQERLAREAREADQGADFPGEGEGDGAEQPEAPPAFPTPELEGEGQLSLNVGGEKPDTSLVKMTGVEINVPNGGEFKKGQYLDVVLRVRVAGVHVDDKFDKQTGTVVGTTRKHILKPLRVERVD